MTKQHFEAEFHGYIVQHETVYEALKEIHEALTLYCPKIASSRMLLSALASAVTEYYLNTNKYDEEKFLGKVIYPLTNGEPVNLPEFKTFNSLLFPTQVISDFEAEFHGNKTTVQTIFYVLCDIECALRKAYPNIEEHAVMHHLMTLLHKAVTNYYYNSDNFDEGEFFSDVAYAISEGDAVPFACFQEFNEEFLMSIAS